MKISKQALLFGIYMTIIFAGGLWANTTLNDMLAERNQLLLNNK